MFVGSIIVYADLMAKEEIPVSLYISLVQIKYLIFVLVFYWCKKWPQN